MVWSPGPVPTAALAAILLLGTVRGLPQGFTQQTMFSATNKPMLPMQIVFLPDAENRFLIIDKHGTIYIGKENGYSTPMETYMTVPNVYSEDEVGLLSVLIEPEISWNAGNKFIYVYYANRQNGNQGMRISRFTHDDNNGGTSSRGKPFTENPLWVDTDGFPVGRDPDSNNEVLWHYGGQLSWGPDGHIYLGLGDKYKSEWAQQRDKHAGCVIRITKTGGIPAGNLPSWKKPAACWAYGGRNLYRATWDLFPRGQERYFAAEIGGNYHYTASEDLHIVDQGDNLGWPLCEGGCSNDKFAQCRCNQHDDPIYNYEHNNKEACIIGGMVYRDIAFPHEYQGAYFFGDYVHNTIKYIKFTFDGSRRVRSVHHFDNTGGHPLGFVIDREGAMWYIESPIGTYKVNRIKSNFGGTNIPPEIEYATASPLSGAPPLTVSLNSHATDGNNHGLSYTWLIRGQVAERIPNEMGNEVAVPSVTPTFVLLGNGCCRTTNGNGNNRDVNAFNIQNCEQQCADDANCKAFEWGHRSGVCEKHFDTPTHTATNICACYVKEGTVEGPAAPENGILTTQLLGASTQFTFEYPGTYTVQLVAEDFFDATYADPVEIIIGAQPEVTLSYESAEFQAGEVVTIHATSFDDNDGDLTASITWEVAFMHNQHHHPYGNINTQGPTMTLQMPSSGHSFEEYTGFRFIASSINNYGIRASEAVTLTPRKTTTTFVSSPFPLPMTFHDNNHMTPVSFPELVGFEVRPTVPEITCFEGASWSFSHWSEVPGMRASTTRTASYITNTENDRVVAYMTPMETGGTTDEERDCQSLYRINVGGLALTDQAGHPWETENAYVTNGWSTVSPDTLQGLRTEHDLRYNDVLLTERYLPSGSDTMTFSFAVSDGAYLVRMLFKEAYYGAAGLRIFNVAVQGEVLLENLDVFAEAGKGHVLHREVLVVATEGAITIDLTRVVENPMINAIMISQGTAAPTAVPTTSTPTSAPTSSVPTSSPTTSVPTTAEPSLSPTTSKPTSSPTTSRPTLMPTQLPSTSPTTSTPTAGPVSSQPTGAPTFVIYPDVRTGCCRTVNGGGGTFDKHRNIWSQQFCQQMCSDSEACVAFEFIASQGICEIHYAAVPNVAAQYRHCICVDKVTVNPVRTVTSTTQTTQTATTTTWISMIPTMSEPTQAPTLAPTGMPTTSGPTSEPTTPPTTSTPTLAPTALPTAYDPCHVGPCLNGATCINVLLLRGDEQGRVGSNGDTPGDGVEFECICAEGYFGDTCGHSAAPTTSPSTHPTAEPTDRPTRFPTAAPTALPTAEPTDHPTGFPTTAPTALPTAEPTTSEPTTSEPSQHPTTSEPSTSLPTVVPTLAPTNSPTYFPTALPTLHPTSDPTTSEPTTSEPTTSEPTTSEPTAYDPCHVGPCLNGATCINMLVLDGDDGSSSGSASGDAVEFGCVCAEGYFGGTCGQTDAPTTSLPTTSVPTWHPTTSEPTTLVPTWNPSTSVPTWVPTTPSPIMAPSSAPSMHPTQLCPRTGKRLSPDILDAASCLTIASMCLANLGVYNACSTFCCFIAASTAAPITSLPSMRPTVSPTTPMPSPAPTTSGPTAVPTAPLDCPKYHYGDDCGIHCKLEQATDFAGNPVSGTMVQTTSYDECALACVGHPQCTVFTIIWEACWLKFSSSGRTANPHGTSAVCHDASAETIMAQPKDVTSTHEPSTSYDYGALPCWIAVREVIMGGDITPQPFASTLAECADACIGVAGCSHFTHLSGIRCYLKSFPTGSLGTAAILHDAGISGDCAVPKDS